MDEISARDSALTRSPLTIFVPHASAYLTDHRAHGDGLIAYEIVSRLALRGHEVFVAAPQADIVGLKPRSLHISVLGMGASPAPLRQLGYMGAMRRYFRRIASERKIDIVHQLNPVYTGISLALPIAHVPLVLGSYIADWPEASESKHAMTRIRFPGSQALRRQLASEQQRRAAAILLATPSALSRVIRPDRDGTKIEIVPHALDPTVYARAALTPPSGVPPTILYVGGIERRKGVDLLVRAFDAVIDEVPEARLILAGTGHMLDEVTALVAESKGRDRITLVGRLGREQLPELLSRCSVMCLPSWHEPFGMSLLEAMASARPVVVTAGGGPNDIVDDRGGVRVPVGDVAALARGLVQVLRSEHIDDMGSYNRDVVIDRYSWDYTIDRLETIYRRLISAAS